MHMAITNLDCAFRREGEPVRCAGGRGAGVQLGPDGEEGVSRGAVRGGRDPARGAGGGASPPRRRARPQHCCARAARGRRPARRGCAAPRRHTGLHPLPPATAAARSVLPLCLVTGKCSVREVVHRLVCSRALVWVRLRFARLVLTPTQVTLL